MIKIIKANASWNEEGVSEREREFPTHNCDKIRSELPLPIITIRIIELKTTKRSIDI